MITQESEPSYGSIVKRGFTSLPERFETPDAKYPHASFNHHFFGDVSAWFIKSVCGINLNPDANDIHFVRIAPHFLSALDHAKAYHIAPDGKISVEWTKKSDRTELTLDVPASMKFEFLPDLGWSIESDVNNKYILVKNK